MPNIKEIKPDILIIVKTLIVLPKSYFRVVTIELVFIQVN